MSYNLQEEINKAQIQSGAEIEKARAALDQQLNTYQFTERGKANLIAGICNKLDETLKGIKHNFLVAAKPATQNALVEYQNRPPKHKSQVELMEQQLKIELVKAEAQTLPLQEAIAKLQDEQDPMVFEILKGSLLAKYTDKEENMAISTVKYVNQEEQALFNDIQTVGFIDMRVLDYMVPMQYDYGKSDVKQLLLGKEEVSDYFYSAAHKDDNVAGGAE